MQAGTTRSVDVLIVDLSDLQRELGVDRTGVSGA